MELTVRLRRAWVRNRTHTVVFDRDPDFKRFTADPSGEVQGLLQLWAQEDEDAAREYLGSVRLCSGRFRAQDLFRLFRRSASWAERNHADPASLRHALARWLRKCQTCGAD